MYEQAAAWFAFEQKYTLRTWICYGILASSDKLTCKKMTLSWHRSISVWQRCQDCHGESALKEKQFPFWNVLFQCYVLPATYSLFVQCQMVQNLLKAKSHFMCGKLSWGKTFLRDDIFRLKNGEYERSKLANFANFNFAMRQISSVKNGQKNSKREKEKTPLAEVTNFDVFCEI